MMWLTLLSAAWAACLSVEGTDSSGDSVRLQTRDGRFVAPDQTGCVAVEVPKGAVVTPGLVEVGSSVGLAEVGAEKATVHNRAGGDDIRASFVVADAYDPVSVHVPVLRRGGITSAVIVPRGGFVSGQSGFVRLWGATQAETIEARSVGVHVNLDGESFASDLDRLRTLLSDVRTFNSNRAAVDRAAFRSFSEGASVQDLAALQAVVQGDLPLVVDADRAARIEALIRFAEIEKVRLILGGAAEGWRVREQLADAKIPVILDPFVYGAGGFDQRQGRAGNAALLSEAGVTVLFNSWTHNAPSLTQFAGNAVRGGMEPGAALDAITVNPRAVFGQPAGGLVVGQPADFVIWSGDPLEMGSRPLTVVVGGEIASLESRQSALFERYRDLPGSPLPILSLPIE